MFPKSQPCWGNHSVPFTQTSCWGKEWERSLILHSSLHLLGEQKEQDATLPLGSSQCHCVQQHLSDPRHLWNVSWPLPAPFQSYVPRKKRKTNNKIRNKQTTREENKPPNPLEWLPWIISGQAGLNLLGVLVFESKEAFGTYLKLKWWAVKALAGTGISSAYMSALFLPLAPAARLTVSRDSLGRAVGGSSGFCCDPLPATAAPFNTCPFLLIFRFYQSNGACDRLVNN